MTAPSQAEVVTSLVLIQPVVPFVIANPSRQYPRAAFTMKDRGDAVDHSTTLDPEKLKATVDPTTEADSQSGDDLDGNNSRNHVFSDPLAAEHWRNIYEKAGYENRHRFDPGFAWTADDERKLVRKVDLRIMTWAVSSFRNVSVSSGNS